MNDADAWTWIRPRLQTGTVVRNWTAKNGYIGEDFIVREAGTSFMRVELLNGNHICVSSDDFSKVGDHWTDYCSGKVARHQLRDQPNRNTKYVISILHHHGFR